MKPTVTLYFEPIWDELRGDEKYEIVKNNLDMITDNDLIAELENRDYEISKS